MERRLRWAVVQSLGIVWIVVSCSSLTIVNAARSFPVMDAPAADIEATEIVSPPSGISALGKQTYTVHVKNHGPADATQVVMTDSLPDGINLGFVSVTSNQGTCNQSGAVVTCALGTLTVDAEATITVIVHPLTTGSRTNGVNASAAEDDPNPENNAASVSSSNFEVGLTDLTVTQSETPDPVLAGTSLTYHVTVSNIQDDCAANVMMTDTLPASVGLVSIVPSQGVCSGLTCNLGTLCPSQRASVQIVVFPNAPGSITNTASIPERASDPGGNNVSTATTTVAADFVSVVATDAEAAELGRDPATFTIARQGDATNEIIVGFALSGGATVGHDYDALPDLTRVTIRRGQTSTAVTVTPRDDLTPEGTETVVLTLFSGNGYALSADRTATASIADHPRGPVVSITANDQEASELGSDPGAFTITRSGDLSSDLTVSVVAGGTAIAPEDYSFLPAVSGTILLSAGHSSATLVVNPRDDVKDEPTEIVTLTLQPEPKYEIATPSSAQVRIANHSKFPVVSIVATDADASELGRDPGMFTISRTGTLSTPLTVFLHLGGTASPSTDYELLPTLHDMVTIPSGHASVAITLVPVDEEPVEGLETSELNIVPSGEYVLGSQSTATITIADHPVVPKIATVSVAVTDGTASERGREPGTFMVTRAGNTSRPLDVWVLIGGTAEGSDYTTSPLIADVVTIPAGQNSVPVNVVPNDDFSLEGPETVVLTIVDAEFYNVGSAFTASLTIVDSDAPPAVSVAPLDPIAGELGRDHGTFVLTRTGDLTRSLKVSVSVSGTATRGTDYGWAQGSTADVTISAGRSSATVDVIPIDDDDEEGNETVVLTVRSGSGYEVGSQQSATVTIIDHPVVPLITVTATIPVTIEPVDNQPRRPQPATFTITRFGDLTTDLVVPILTSGTARVDRDYGFSPELTSGVRLPRHLASAIVQVRPLSDTEAEGTETVTLSLLDGAEYDLGAETSATVSIVDTDVPPIVTVTAEPLTVNEGSSRVGGTFNISRVGDLSKTLTVSAIFLGTAIEDRDFTAGHPISSGITIPSGRASTIVRIDARRDGLVEGNETIVLMLLPRAEYDLGAPSSATMTITDPPPLSHQ